MTAARVHLLRKSVTDCRRCETKRNDDDDDDDGGGGGGGGDDDDGDDDDDDDTDEASEPQPRHGGWMCRRP